MKTLTGFGLLAALFAGTSLAFGAGSNAPNFLSKDAAWYKSDEGIAQIDRIISWQLPVGGWEKGYDADKTRPADAKVTESGWRGVGTIDNNYTHTELRELAKAFSLTQRPNVKAAFDKALDFLLAMQNEQGGWPQRFPLPKDYGRFITLNDNAMIDVMEVLSEVAKKKGDFAFVTDEQSARAQKAIDKGLELILKLQIVSQDKLTGWCQQYDDKTLEPAKARAYELPCISSSESAAIMKYMMKLENPSPQVQKSVHACAAWLEASRIENKKLVKGSDKVTLADAPGAPTLWSRYYEIGTNRPFVCGRDGIKKYDISEIEKERATGYAWYREFGNAVLKDYPKWAKKYPAEKI